MSKIREGYKETEIGVIPEDWEVVMLGDISSLITKGTTPTTLGFGFEEIGINFIKVENVTGSGKIDINSTPKISEECNLKLSRSKLEGGDIIISIAGTIGRSAIVQFSDLPANTNQALAIVRLKSSPDIVLRYINYTFSSDYFRFYIDAIRTVGAQPNMSLKQLQNFVLAFPCKQEQQRIAEILSTTDEHIEKLDKTIEDYQLLKKGMMRKLLTEGIGHTEFKETEIGMIPKEWKVKELREFCETMSGGTPSRKRKDFYINGTIPWIKTGELRKKYITESEEYITEIAVENSSAKLANEDSILLAMYGATIGKCSILKIKATTNQACCIINPFKGVGYNEFLYYYLAFDKDNIIAKGAGGAQPNISQQIIKLHLLPLPPYDEQKQIADILSQLDNKIELYQNQKQDFTLLKKSLMEKLLTGKIRTI